MMQVYGNQRGPYGPIKNYMGSVKNQGPCKPHYMPFPANHRNQVPPVGHFQPQFLPPRPNFYPSPQTLVPPYSCGGYNFQGQGGSTSASSVPHRLPPQGIAPVNSAGPVVSGLLGSLMAQGVISLKNQSRGGLEGTSSLNSLPLVPQQGALPVQNAATDVPVVLPGLIDSLLAQGVISLKKQSRALKQEKDAVVGCEFSGLDLNLRRESVVIGLYEGGLPRQCKSCGLRFKCEEQHSSHMDWHVKKNRMSKTRKQKPSRNFYATTSMWLVTDVEAEAEALPSGVVLCAADTSGVAEKKRKTSDEEMVVPADEDQSKCALCTDAFVEFYSHEIDEWMYKGAVYLNAPQGPALGMVRSQLGPIVHAKCWSEGSRKRLRRT
ncbi:polyadenylation and cleavage factor homolog 4-like [Rosa chinensis]|uniref:polyadenylation and cleavage factor homolog 4-like n=1 Tax=Rosa chinensis TaxID=74649 RepID=UPI000D08AB3D|nr:polyadenylation and cleavage factor homolog 4-like [Rosa chinensis]